MDIDRLQSLLAALEREGVNYAIFGAMALNLHGLARFTEDLDLFIAPEAENVERLKRALKAVFDDPAIDEISAADLLDPFKEMKTPRWRGPGDPELYRAMANLWEIAKRTSTRRYPPGVYRHVSIEDMQETQERWRVVK